MIRALLNRLGLAPRFVELRVTMPSGEVEVFAVDAADARLQVAIEQDGQISVSNARFDPPQPVTSRQGSEKTNPTPPLAA